MARSTRDEVDNDDKAVKDALREIVVHGSIGTMAERGVVVQAARTLYEIHHGKPVQPVKKVRTGKSPRDLSLEEIQREIARLEAIERGINGDPQ